MWLVSQPDSVILQVKADPNAIGQECLERVSPRSLIMLGNNSVCLLQKDSSITACLANVFFLN